MEDNTSDESQDNNAGSGSDNQKSSLNELRSRALSILLPLVDSIDEPSERKFEILMTAARTTDDPELLEKALNMAQQMNSNSEKANAVLDVLNEINFHLNDQTD